MKIKNIALMILVSCCIVAFLAINTYQQQFKTEMVLAIVTTRRESSEKEFSIDIKKANRYGELAIAKNIIVENKNVWNLIEENKTYLIVYTENAKGECKLQQIEPDETIGENYRIKN